jgi:hypothetical protein
MDRESGTSASLAQLESAQDKETQKTAPIAPNTHVKRS